MPLNENLMDKAIKVWDEVFNIPDSPERRKIFEALGNLTETILKEGKNYDKNINANHGSGDFVAGIHFRDSKRMDLEV